MHNLLCLSVDYSYSCLFSMKFLRHETNQLSVRLTFCGRRADSNFEALIYCPDYSIFVGPWLNAAVQV